MLNLAGLYPPITIAFNDDESIAYDKFEANLQHWISQPLDGVLIPGSNSEAAYLTRQERLDVWRTVAGVIRGTGKRFIAGTGAETTAETIQFTEEAAKLGAVATLIVPPYFYKPQYDHVTMLAHYRAVADVSPIPVLVYNVPAFTGVDFAPNTLIAMAEHPRIIGMKDSSSNILKVAAVKAACPDFQIFAGTGGALLPFLSIGAAGGIMALANFAAVPLRKLYDAFQAGNLAEAQRIQLSLVDINTAVTSRFGVAGLKYAMDRSGFHGGPCRRPLLPANAQVRAEIDRLLAPVQLT